MTIPAYTDGPEMPATEPISYLKGLNDGAAQERERIIRLLMAPRDKGGLPLNLIDMDTNHPISEDRLRHELTKE